MSNCEKKLDALIDALGFDCDVEFNQQKYDANMDGLGRVGTDYELIVRRSCQGVKLTKRKGKELHLGTWMGVDIIVHTEQEAELMALIAHLGTRKENEKI